LVAAAFALLPPALTVSACADGGTDEPGPGAGGTSGEQGICLLNNCSDDSHCVGCPDGRDTCLVAENRCVACDPNTGSGCDPGYTCSPYGICAPEGQVCNTDGEGNPTVSCTQNSDCLACDPMHQVCDSDTGKCQACTETNTQHCLSSDICIDTDEDGQAESCSPKCPASCDDNNDCGLCIGAGGKPAKACFQHSCSECGPNWACPAGQECLNGVCTQPCGSVEDPGKCDTDNGNEDCAGCNQGEGQAWTCKEPINGGNHGTCTPPAAGCEDLGGPGLAVLPPPFDQITQLCSSDANCNGIGIDFNVGEAIRDLIGSDSLDLGFAEVEIHDAVVEYGLPKCASIELVNDIDCGVCVPCEQDSDCKPIPVTPLFADLFAGDPLAQIAAALLVDQLWGDDDTPSLHFFCQPVAAGYGACLPCGNPTQACGSSGGGSGMCDHESDEIGGPLDPSCGPCEAEVCAADDFCCNTEWDDVCVDEAAEMCGGCPDPCSQSLGTPHDQGCDACRDEVCTLDSYCCTNEWDDVCVEEALEEPACGGVGSC
jgi:hypothetical protein